MPRALVIQTSFLGDMVLTTPLISALARHGDVDVVATSASAPLLANHPDVRHVFRYDKRGEHSGVGGFRALVQHLRSRDDSDVAYLAQGSLRSAALALVAGYRQRVGFDTSAGRIFYSRQVQFRKDEHHAGRLWRLAAGDDAEAPGADVLRPRLYPGVEEDAAVARRLDASGYAGEALIALAPGSVWATKRWPYYADLARRLTTFGRIVIVGGVDDTPLAAAIVEATSGRAIDTTGQLSLLASAALLGRSRILVTNDSAPQHLASAMDTPTVALFGPTVPAFGFGPLAARARIAQVESLTCRPCDAHGPRTCPLTHWRCMRDLTVDRVMDAIGHVHPGM